MQLELFAEGPFALRLRVAEALGLLWDNYWRHLPSAKSCKAHFRRLAVFYKDHYLDTVSKADVERLRRFMKEMGYSEPTINKAHMILSRLFTKMTEYKEGRFVNGVDFSKITLPAPNPAALVPKVNERQFARKVNFTKEIKNRFCGYCPDEDLAEIIDGLFWTQLRPSDFFRFTPSSVDLAARTISGVQSKTITTKYPTGVPFKVHIPESKVGMIVQRITQAKPGTPLFKRKNMQKRWKEVRRRAGMPQAQLRDIRGGAASFLLDNGVDPETVRKGLGHTTLRMLPNYDKRPEDRVMKATEKLVEA